VARRRPLHQQRDNDLCLGRLDNSSDGLRANATTERPSFTSPHGGREPAIKAKEPEVRSAGGTNGLVGRGNRFSKGSLTYGDHHPSADDSGHMPTNTAPANGGRPKAQQQGSPLPRSKDDALVFRSSNSSRTRNRRPANRPSRRINSLAGQATPLAGEAGAVSPPS
jgi:hypothetical protein